MRRPPDYGMYLKRREPVCRALDEGIIFVALGLEGAGAGPVAFGEVVDAAGAGVG